MMAHKSDDEKRPWGLGAVWIAGWLFTIGFLGHGFWQGVLALVLWPYQIGQALAGF